MTDLLSDLQARGLVASSTDLGALAESMAGGITVYAGFDPTASSLHVGNLVPLLLLRRFQQAGHRVIALVGGATGLIGDPSGRSAERTLNTDDTVASWVERVRGQLQHFLDFDGDNPATLVSNLEWTAPMSAIEFLRDVGKHFSVNAMLGKESIAARLNGDGISYTEFSYMLLQAMDYLHLYRDHDCALQVGGSDQWGNITAGLDLIRRVEGPESHAHGLTVPLVTKADGTKFGKTAGGAIWLDAEQTSPFAFYQFWLNTDDRDIASMLRYFSLRPLPDIEQVIAEGERRPASRAGQRALAAELTDLVHGRETREHIEAASAALFGRGDLQVLPAQILRESTQDVPTVGLPAETSVVDAFLAAGLSDSKSAARRAIKEGGAYINNERVSDGETALPADRALHGRWLLLRRGKRSIAVVDVVG
ncbi:MAG TPA: tyrosine--tRNA ligase [Actinomycetota bacterium]|nr:tyrosine--tRNA ligase [Candidatus Nanopelagicales bacterium]HPE11806.1 tyrosine--tRNA ligase [Actinomycetota bacterium]HPQ83295.1 tyrosine--tRNA ligase [Actinomycetota bacterium]HRV66439.1 tyrosine--tRNA ligase [Candidatus Nanopelagicales bacterium]